MSDDLTTVWRVPGKLRVVVLGVIVRDERLLVSAVTQDDGSIKGWRPLGGGIEFGEWAEAALHREFEEELGARLRDTRQIGVMENLFSHAGQVGHEVVFLFEASLAEPGQASADRFILEDGPWRNQAGWIAVEDFRQGREVLLPEGLLAFL